MVGEIMMMLYPRTDRKMGSDFDHSQQYHGCIVSNCGRARNGCGLQLMLLTVRFLAYFCKVGSPPGALAEIGSLRYRFNLIGWWAYANALNTLNHAVLFMRVYFK